MATDLPEPVAPATSKWGVFFKSKTIGLPSESLPNAISILLLSIPNVNDDSWTTDFIPTISLLLCGISIPTTFFPGTGAWILNDLAARANLILSSRFVIFVILTA